MRAAAVKEAIRILSEMAPEGKIGGRVLNIIDPAELVGKRVGVHGHAPFMKVLRERGSTVPVMQVLGGNKKVLGSSLDNMLLRDAQVAYDNFERKMWLDEYKALRNQFPDLPAQELQKMIGKRRQVFLRGTMDAPAQEVPQGLRSIRMNDLASGPVDAETGFQLDRLPSFGDLYLGGSTGGILYQPNEMALDLLSRGVA